MGLVVYASLQVVIRDQLWLKVGLACILYWPLALLIPYGSIPIILFMGSQGIRGLGLLAYLVGVLLGSQVDDLLFYNKKQA